jgi:hypothetical protein
MGGTHVDRLRAFGIDPALPHPAAWECERMGLVLVDDGEFQFAVERCGGDGKLHEDFVMQLEGRAL